MLPLVADGEAVDAAVGLGSDLSDLIEMSARTHRTSLTLTDRLLGLISSRDHRHSSYTRRSFPRAGDVDQGVEPKVNVSGHNSR
jgi:hypothetical protein